MLIDGLSIVHVGPHVVMFTYLLCSVSCNGHVQLVDHNQFQGNASKNPPFQSLSWFESWI